MNGRRGQLRRAAPVWLWLVLYLVAGMAHAADAKVRAFLDRSQVPYGDSVTLNVEMEGATSFAAPDIEALKQDFDILGTSRNSHIGILDGKRRATSIWAVQLRPRRAGKITIPALSVDGQRTRPLALEVVAASAARRGGPGDAVFIETELDTRTPYVGQQVALTVRLFYTPAISRGSLDMPADDAVKLVRLGDGTRYQTRRGGQFYDVLERHYALTVRHAGPVNLAPVAFRGAMQAGGGFFGDVQRVSALSDPFRLAVRAKPAAAGKGHWLPARRLELHLQGVPDDGKLEVGQPLTLTLTESVRGLPFESLPEPELPPLDGVDVYPDPSQDQTGHEGPWLTASRTRAFSLVPRRPGRLVLPAITLTWWNVEKDRPETARLPARTLEVMSATGAAPATAATTVPSRPGAAGMAAVEPAPAAPARSDAGTGDGWRWLAVLAVLLWGVTAVVATWLWWRRRRTARSTAVDPRPPREGENAKRRRRAFLRAVREGDVSAQCGALLAWARAERDSVHHLGDLASALAPGAQPQAVADLQRARYGDGPAPEPERLREVFGRGFRWRETDGGHPRDADTLPPLYP